LRKNQQVDLFIFSQRWSVIAEHASSFRRTSETHSAIVFHLVAEILDLGSSNPRSWIAATIAAANRYCIFPYFGLKKGFCSEAIFEILSAPHDKQRKVNLQEPLFYGNPAGKRQKQQTGDESFHEI
jgi:hypothetical protein